MKFPNLVWAIAQRRLAHYQVAAAISVGESAFSRRVSGRLEFSPDERKKIAKLLAFPEGWLFAEANPPPSQAVNR